MHIGVRRALLAFVVFLFHSADGAWVSAEDSAGALGRSPSAKAQILRRYQQANWLVLETENFCVYTEGNERAAIEIVSQAESLRSELRLKWLGDEQTEAWNPRCNIYIHPTRQRYVATAGRGSERTVGSSQIKVDRGKVVVRRIDLAPPALADLTASALPHELTHVVLKDRFLSTTLPHWADEGAAILADSRAKQDRHANDLRSAIAGNATFGLAAMLPMDGYPAANQFGAFYGQSASLAEFLIRRKDARTFVDFVTIGKARGYETALRECYEISSLAELDRLWRVDITSAVAVAARK